MIGNQRLTMSVLRNMPAHPVRPRLRLFSLLDQRFFTVTNFSNITSTAAFIGIIAVGMTFVLLTGGIDLSVGRHDVHRAAVWPAPAGRARPLLLAIGAGVVAGTIWGCFNGFLIAKVGIVPFMATLATLTVGARPRPAPHRVAPASCPARDALRGHPGAGHPHAHPRLRHRRGRRPSCSCATRAIGRQIYAMGNDVDAAKKAGLNTRRLTARRLRHERLLRGPGRRRAGQPAGQRLPRASARASSSMPSRRPSWAARASSAASAASSRARSSACCSCR